MYELSYSSGKVVEIISEDFNYMLIEVNIPDQGNYPAVNYNNMTGRIKIGDQVIVNTTAVELNLGTGGLHFVSCNLNNINKPLSTKSGHIIKLRYTPVQVRTGAIEETEKDVFNQQADLDGCPVVILPLHSLLAPLIITFKTFYPKKKVVYIMTEGGSLSLDFSNQVRSLKKEGLLDTTITIGNAFGGDIEAINIFTGLLAARNIIGGDLIITGMGPGIVGSGTRYGFSGVENAFIAYAVSVFGGSNIVVPRVSMADNRKRHQGISHHVLTLLKELLVFPVDIVFPEEQFIKNIVEKHSIGNNHRVFYYPVKEIKNILRDYNNKFNSMGRSLEDDPLFFSTAGLAVYRLQELLLKE